MSAAEAIGAYIGQKLGLIPQERWTSALKRAEPDLLRRRGVGLEELARRIDTDVDVYLELAGLLSVGETYFLRHGAHFDLLVRHVARRLASLGPDEHVDIWSAGCSSGEEPYSIAIAIHARLGPEALARVRIVATDVDPRAIAKAERARFTAWSFRGAPPWLLSTYFAREPGGGATLEHEGVKRAVRFQTMPLGARAPLFSKGSLDVVFFRNVAIYLLDDAREALQREMRRALRDGGLLFQGPSDPPPPSEAFALVPDDTTYCCFEAGRAPSLRETTTRVYAPKPGRGATARETRRPPALAHRTPSASMRATAAPSANGALAPVSSATVRSPAEVEAALALAERGEVAAALARVALGEAELDATARVLRGKIFLAARRFSDAVSELRAAVFLEPHPILPRYWYASALHAARADRLASAQLRELERRLEALDSSAFVEDGETPATELLGSVRFLLEAYE